MSRRYGSSEVDIREDHRSVSRNGGRYDDRYSEEDIQIRRSRPSAPVVERDREEIDIRETRTREPDFLRPDYGRPAGGQIVLSRREREDFSYAPRRGRTPSPAPERKETETIIVRKEESDRPTQRPPPSPSRDREEIIIRQNHSDHDSRRRYDYDDSRSSRAPSRGDQTREEIIIRHNDEEDRYLRPGAAKETSSDYALVKPRSRERSRHRQGSDSEDEIIVRRDEHAGPRGDQERQEIIVRHHSHSDSPSPTRSSATSRPAPRSEPAIINAPTIHQEVVTHHRHIDHGYEVSTVSRPRPVSRPPSPPSPPLAPVPRQRDRSEERIEIRRHGERNGRPFDEDIVIDRNGGGREYYQPEPRPRPLPPPALIEPQEARLGGRYGRTRDPTAGLWTEITKDLVVKEAIQEMGYEFEENEENFYIIAYLEYDDVSRLVGLSEDIRRDRRRRIKEMGWESRVAPEAEEPRRPLAIEGPPARRDRDAPWAREEDERYIEREVIYRGGRPPPPVGWRR